MHGFSRSEFILVSGVPYFLEMNTVPGLTAASILPEQAKQAGISNKSLSENRVIKRSQIVYLKVHLHHYPFISLYPSTIVSITIF